MKEEGTRATSLLSGVGSSGSFEFCNGLNIVALGRGLAFVLLVPPCVYSFRRAEGGACLL